MTEAKVPQRLGDAIVYVYLPNYSDTITNFILAPMTSVIQSRKDTSRGSDTPSDIALFMWEFRCAHEDNATFHKVKNFMIVWLTPLYRVVARKI